MKTNITHPVYHNTEIATQLKPMSLPAFGPLRKQINSFPFLLLASLFLINACTNAGKDAPNNTSKDSLAKHTSIPGTRPDPFAKNGEEKTKYENGVIKTLGNYKNGKRDGQWYSWYSDGKPWSETYFDNGIKNGPTKTWFENGTLRYAGQFKNDVESGVWNYYNQEGKLEKTIDYPKK